jgi:hypothetical protein
MTPTQPAGLLMPFLLAVLTPLLMAGGILDPDLARQAALETIAAYQAADNRQLLTTTQVIAFALAALENLRLSAAPDLSLSMKLKLRGNANALNRASQKTAAMLVTPRANPPAEAPDQAPAEAPDQADVMASLKSAQTLLTQARATDSDRKTDLRWGHAMTDIAAEYTAELPVLPPEQRRAHLTRIDALSKIATMLGRGDAPPIKARLLASTTMAA